MTVNEIYKRFLLKINKNDTNGNVKVSKGVFVLFFNELSKFWLESKIKEEGKSFLKNHLSELLILDKELTKKEDKNNFTTFSLPEDFFDIESAYSIASKGACTNRVLYNYDFKQRNKNVIFTNENEKPSFEYQETLYNLNKEGLSVYKEGFNIDKQFISYYKLPKEIDIEGYTRFDGTPSQNIETDLEDKNIMTIINMCSLEAVTNFENGETFQLQKQRLINN